MYAIVEIAGQQFNVEPSIRLTVNRLAGEIGDKVEFKGVVSFLVKIFYSTRK